MAIYVAEWQKSTQCHKIIIFQLKIKFFKIFEKLQKNKLGCFVPFLESRLISQKFSKTELSNLFFFKLEKGRNIKIPKPHFIQELHWQDSRTPLNTPDLKQ